MFGVGLGSPFQYSTLQNAAQILAIASPNTVQTNLINLLLQRCSVAMETYCRRIFGPQVYAGEIYDGTGTALLTLNQTPVLSIQSLYDDVLAYNGDAPGAFAAGTLLTQGTDYFLKWDNGPGSQSSSGIVQRIANTWEQPINYQFGILSANLGPGIGNIKVTYTAGFLGTPWVSISGLTTVNGQMSVTGFVNSGSNPVVPGMVIIGTGIPVGTYVVSIAGGTLTLSQAATANGTITAQFNIPAPADVQMACDLIIATVKRFGKWGAAIASGSYDGASISFVQGIRLGLMNEMVMGILAPYVTQAVA